MQEDWKDYKLGDLGTFIGGVTSIKPDDYGHGTPFITYKNIYKNSKVNADELELMKVSQKDIQKRSCIYGDILFTASSETPDEVAMSSVLLDTIPNLTFNGFSKRYRLNDFNTLSPEFARYLFRNKLFRQEIYQLATGDIRFNISQESLAKIKITIPDLSIQNKISSILSSLDDKIELNLKMNKTLEAIAQAIFKEWFVDFRFPGFDGELVDGLPKGWRKTSIGELGLYITDLVANGSFAVIKDNVKTYEDCGFALFMRNTDLKSGFRNKVFVDEHSYNFLKKSKLFGGELIISNVGDIGSVHLCPSFDIPMTLGNNCIMVRSELYEKWLYMFFKSELGQHKLKGAVIGSVQEKLSKTNFRKIEIKIPPKVILEEFNKVGIPILHRIEVNIKENNVLSNIRDTLLPKLMAGKIRIA